MEGGINMAERCMGGKERDETVRGEMNVAETCMGGERRDEAG